MAIRQNKNYKFNFTLADGSIKTITHSVPLPVASEIGCESITFEKSKFYKKSIPVSIGGSSTGLNIKMVSFDSDDGCIFDITKNKKVTILRIQGDSYYPDPYVTAEYISTSDDKKTIEIEVKCTEFDESEYDYILTLETEEIEIKQNLYNIQDNLNYLSYKIRQDEDLFDKHKNDWLTAGFPSEIFSWQKNFVTKGNGTKQISKEVYLKHGAVFDNIVKDDNNWITWVSDQTGQKGTLQNCSLSVVYGNNKNIATITININSAATDVIFQRDITYTFHLTWEYRYTSPSINDAVQRLFKDYIENDTLII